MHMMHRVHEIADVVPPDALETRRLSSSSAVALIIALSALLWAGLFNLVRLLAAYHT